jgi:hypothetical protein
MDADEFRDYILGFIFYKYLSEKMHLYADKILREDGIKYQDIDENSEEGREFLDAVKEEAILKLGYFLKPSELFGGIGPCPLNPTIPCLLKDKIRIFLVGLVFSLQKVGKFGGFLIQYR